MLCNEIEISESECFTQAIEIEINKSGCSTQTRVSIQILKLPSESYIQKKTSKR